MAEYSRRGDDARSWLAAFSSALASGEASKCITRAEDKRSVQLMTRLREKTR
jgi:hypothetical protein